MFRRSFSPNRNRFHPRGSFGRSNNTGRRGSNRAIVSVHPEMYVNKAVSRMPEEVYVVRNNFADFAIGEQLKKNIIQRGYTMPTPIQDQVIPHVLTGRDVVGIANTGTGKTAAFLLPLIDKVANDRSQRVLIMAPTRELAVQIESELREFSKFMNVFSVLLIGGANINRQMWSMKNNPSFVIGTPGRLKDLANRRVLQLSGFKTVVLDEVDRMVDIGFIKDIKYLISMLPYGRQSLFFSATVSKEITGIIQVFLKNPITVSVKKHETAANIDQDVIKVGSQEEKITKLHSLLSQEEFKKVLIFGRTKWSVEKLARNLADKGFSSTSIHGNKSQGQRQRALTMFKQDRLQVLVATDLAARGLDIDDVTHVINFDEPASYDDYVHRIGRTGRANKAGKALTFVV